MQIKQPYLLSLIINANLKPFVNSSVQLIIHFIAGDVPTGKNLTLPKRHFVERGDQAPLGRPFRKGKLTKRSPTASLLISFSLHYLNYRYCNQLVPLSLAEFHFQPCKRHWPIVRNRCATEQVLEKYVVALAISNQLGNTTKESTCDIPRRAI